MNKTAMKLENTVTFSISLPYNAGDITPQDFDSEVCPQNLKRRQWIPQTMGDCVWIWYEFHNRNDCEDFLKNLPQKYQAYIQNHHKQEDLEYWKHINGSDGSF